MNLSQRLSNSFYEEITAINEPHKVFLVRHRATGRFFVKKVLDVYSADVYGDLQTHPIPGIPRIYESWEEDGRLIIIEEFISGVTLRDKIEMSSQASADVAGGDTLTTEQIGRYMIGLCEILERLHTHNPPLIHRDLKPSNIIITSCDNVVLLDFNAARFYSGAANKESDTRLLGTRGYAAPEQYGFGESSPQTDLYSMGKILQECVNALPAESAIYKKSYENQGVNQNVNRDVEASRQAGSAHVFDQVIERCTRIDPSGRYTSANELKAALLCCLGQGSQPRSEAKSIRSYFPPGFRTGNPWKILLAVLVYISIFQVSLKLEVKSSSAVEIWMQRLTVLLIALMNVMIGSNYLGIWERLPFHDSDSQWLKVAGVVLTMIVSTFLVFLVLIFTIGAVFR